MSVAKLFTKGVHKQMRYYFTHWLPSATISLGDVGILEDGHFFRPLSTLRDLGIAFDPAQDTEPDTSPTPFDLVSVHGVTITAKAAGDVNSKVPSVPQGKAGLSVEFAAEGGFVIKAAETYEPRIRDAARLQKDVIQAYRTGQWKRNYAVIYSLVQTPYADIIISESAGSKLELEAKGEAAVGNVELGNVGLQFGITSKSGTVLNMLGCRNVCPLFQLIGLKRRLLAKPTSGPLKTFTMTPMSELDLDENPEDMLYLDLLHNGSD